MQGARMDLMSGKVFKGLPRKAITLLTTLYNSILRVSYYPLLWTFAQIIMVPKPGKPVEDVTSYRPISLLHIPSKVFEKLLLKRLKSDIGLSTLLPDCQFGFTAGHSTIHQMHQAVHEIVKGLEGQKLCTAVFFDVAQAKCGILAYWLVIQTQDHTPQSVLPTVEDISSYPLFSSQVQQLLLHLS